MTARPLSFAAPPLPDAASLRWAVLGGLLAAGTGAAVSVSPLLGVGLAIATALVLLVGAQPANVLVILAITLFLEAVTLGGVTITRILAPVALIVLVIEFLRGRAHLKPDWPLLWVGGYVAWALASGLWTVSVSGTVYLLSSLAIALVYMLSFATLLHSERQLKRVLAGLAGVALVVGFSSLASYFDEFGALASTLQGGRAQGGVGDPDFFAAFQLVALPLVIVLTTAVEHLVARLVLYGAAMMIIGSVLVTLSRGAMIALAATMLVLVFLPARSLFGARRHKATVLVVLLLGLTVISSRALPELVARAGSIFASEQRGGSSRGSGRQDIWLTAANSIAERPVLGLGYGAFPEVSNDMILTTPGVDPSTYKSREEGKGLQTHNTYIGAAADLGIPGLVLYVGMLVSTGGLLRRTARRARALGDPFIARVATALVVGLGSWSITSFFLSTETTRALWIIIGLALALPRLAGRGADAPAA